MGPGDGAVKVEYAEAWLKSRYVCLFIVICNDKRSYMRLIRTDPDTKMPLPKTVDAKPYDWTYSTTYAGKAIDHNSKFIPADPDDPSHIVDVAELSKKDPILFYAEIPLYEDELHDNGTSLLTVRVVSASEIVQLTTHNETK